MQPAATIMQNLTQQISSGSLVKPELKATNMTQNSEEISLHSKTIEKKHRSIDRLFLKFAAIYGLVWRKQFHGEFLIYAKGEWLQGLKNFDDNIFDLAVEVCRKTLSLPPTMPRFIEICRSFHNRQFEMPKPAKSFQHFPSKVGKEALMAIKQRLHMNTKPQGEEHVDFN